MGSEVLIQQPSSSVPHSGDSTAPLMQQPKLNIEDMRVSFGAKVVVSGFSLHVTPHSITLLVGGNGTGKSTVLRAVAGIIPSRGRIFLDGADITQCSAKERHKLGISYLVQQHGVFYRMTVRENMAFATRGLARSPDDMLELPSPGSTWAKLWREPASALSIGQQRALAIAMVLKRRPTLALLDEPFAGLSPPAAEELAEYFSHLVLSEGFTIMLVDHNLQLSTTISDRVYAMDQGAARVLPAGVSAEDIASLLLNSHSKNPTLSATEGGL
jgi:branched-chain amino acid transport system ATP-binding protein